MIGYVPAGVFGATLIVPSGFILNGPFGVDVRVTSPGLVPITAGLPFKVSFAITLGVFVPGNTDGVSATASIVAAVTSTTLVTVSQFVGLFTSQIVYVTL